MRSTGGRSTFEADHLFSAVGVLVAVVIEVPMVDLWMEECD